MTTVASIIQSALRETNLIPLGTTATAIQSAEAFGLLSTIVASVLGNEAGEGLDPMPLGQNHITSPQGYPWWSNTIPSNIFIHSNTRIMCNLTGPATVNFNPEPEDGARMGIIDISSNFATYPLTLNGNGRTIEGVNSITFNTNGMVREWIYRDDLGTWAVVIPISLVGTMPFPSDFDDMFIILLAMRLNPRYGQAMHPASMATLKNVTSQFSARYKQSMTEMPSEIGLTRLTNSTRRIRGMGQAYGNANASFNSGIPF